MVCRLNVEINKMDETGKKVNKKQEINKPLLKFLCVEWLTLRGVYRHVSFSPATSTATIDQDNP